MISNLFWLTDAQMDRLRPFFSRSRGTPRLDDRRVLSGIIFINLNCLRCCDAPWENGPPQTLYNRCKRCSAMGVFTRMMESLAAEGTEQKTNTTFAHYTIRPQGSEDKYSGCWSRTIITFSVYLTISSGVTFVRSELSL